MTINGTSGNDTLTGTSGNDVFNLSQGGDDTVSGLGGNDIFKFGAAFTAADSVDGGTGSDILELTGDYSAGITFGASTIASVEEIKLGAGFDYKLSPNEASVAAGNTLSINATALGAGNTLFFDGTAGTDGTYYVSGGSGGDTISMGAHLTAADRIDGGGGADTLFLGGDYSMAFHSTTLRNIGDLVMFGGGHSYHFITNDANVAAGATMQVDATPLDAGNTLVFNGSRETNGNFNFDAGSGGVMDLAAGAGDDAFFMGAGLNNSDRLNGGNGADVLYLGGADYTLSLKAATLQSIENIVFNSGFDYHIISGGDTGGAVSVDGAQLGVGDSLYFNAAKESGSFNFEAGAGPVTFIGGSNSDTFYFDTTTSDMLTAADRINGNGGNDVVNINGLYMGGGALVFNATTMVNVEGLVLGNTIASNCYDITTNDATVAAGQTLTVNGSQLTASQSLTFNGSAETNGNFDILGGADFNILTGGAGNDTFDLTHGGADTVSGGGGDDDILFGNQLTASDQVDGGSGDNSVELAGNYTGASALVFNATTLVNIQELLLGNAVGAAYDITTDDATVAAGQTLAVDAHNLSSTETLTFNGAAETDGHFNIEGGSASDDLTGGALSDSFYYSTLIGVTGAQRDTIHAFDFANDIVQFAAVTGIAAAFTLGAVNRATIDSDLTNILTAARLPAHDALLYTAKSGNLAGHVFLIVDGNGVAGYQQGSDLVIELSGALHSGSISTANFIA